MVALMMMLATSHTFPSYFQPDQRAVAANIIAASRAIQEDPHLLVAIAWTESRLQHGKVSRTGDYGVFQINWRFWGRQLGYSSVAKFNAALADIKLSTEYASQVLQEMRRHHACRGKHLPACYNGGPGWRKSKNRSAILRYANKVNSLVRYFRRNHPEWAQK